jgi:hypothetical protein
MRLVNREELGRQPNGTVFSEITDENFYRGIIGDMDIDQLTVICGHNEEFEFFDGTVGLPKYISISRENGIRDLDYTFDEYVSTDNSLYDYDENSMFIVYDKTDIVEIINVLQWALSGCKSKLFTRGNIEYEQKY